MNANIKSKSPRPGYRDGKHTGQSACCAASAECSKDEQPVHCPRGQADDDALYRKALLEEAIWEELQFLHGKDYKLIKEIKAKLRLPTISPPLLNTDCSDLDAVLRNANVPVHLRIAGFAFLKRLKKNAWLKMLDDGLLPNRVALALAYADFAFSLAQCGYGRRPGRNVGACPQCNKHCKADEVVEEYASVYDKANRHYAITFAYTSSPRLAGVWFVKIKGEKKRGIKPQYERFNPFEACEQVPTLTADDGRLLGDKSPVNACMESFFKAMSRIMRPISK